MLTFIHAGIRGGGLAGASNEEPIGLPFVVAGMKDRRSGTSGNPARHGGASAHQASCELDDDG